MPDKHTSKQYNRSKVHNPNPPTEHLKPFQWKKGVSGNPAGRPKGQTLKEFAREYLLSLSDEDKIAYLAELPPEIVWRMAEGNPHSTEDSTVSVHMPLPILGGMVKAQILENKGANETIEGPTAEPKEDKKP